MSRLLKIAYQPLCGKNEIRLIQIKNPEPVNLQQPLECELVHARRGDPAGYTALSYAWGSSAETRAVKVDGCMVEIGRSLDEGLKALRDHGTTTVWADQLCINQEDDIEKGLQVRQMQDIYSNASNVAVWLGSSTETSGDLMRQLEDLALLSDETVDNSGVLASYTAGEDIEWIPRAFDDFCNRSYWRRLWVIQEFSVGKNVFVLCGRAEISCEPLTQAVRLLGVIDRRMREYRINDQTIPPGLSVVAGTYKSSALSFVQSLTTRRHYHHKPAASNSNSLFSVVVSSLVLELDYNHPECSDPRDRIFSVMGLATDASEFGGFPDYSRKCEDIYEEFARQMFQKGQIDILAYCQFPRRDKDGGVGTWAYRPMSTWAPDWDTPTRRPNTGHPWLSPFMASGDTLAEQEAQFPCPKTVCLKGVFVDIIETVGSLWDPDWLKVVDPGSTMQYLTEIWSLCKQSSRVEEGSTQATFARVAIADRLQSSTPEQQQTCVVLCSALLERLEKGTTTAQRSLLTEREEDFERLVDLYLDQMKYLHSRRPFGCSTGYVGLAPVGAAKGDVVVVFLGGKTPYVVRPREGGGYTLIGEAYVHGIMYGERLDEDWKAQPFKLY